MDRSVAVTLADALLAEVQRRGGYGELAEEVARRLSELGVQDAMMLRRVLLAREWLRDITALFEDLERFFTVGGP